MYAVTAVLQSGCAADFDAVAALLAQAALPVVDLRPADIARFVVARDAGDIVAAAGIEPHGAHGLFRSVVVAPAWRGHGLGAEVVRAAEQAAHDLGVRTLWALTTGAADYFTALGYAAARRDSAPADVQASAQFRSLCPANAACLSKSIE
jgi:amino-acid N-acetyltransferase